MLDALKQGICFAHDKLILTFSASMAALRFILGATALVWFAAAGIA